ncbi:pilus (MSHA type) biogenesis protein MshL [Lacimicrobium alkaliphilum]|uniref:Pilus (MSHA type) biogenesis protein MshL n=1 Tax=Lacimicrobium alkaliphilum TaxID=1526571 RepID=A0ABQ1R853_9ALTE|nr:pilus (MSHA type) biogenesis protein MshL [Lacimicrobium alkaliphilum]GGD61848.1 pilus (MSHA type) biogenesis protein MshL [Lacimicrobium alkaliphilum]
MAFKHVIFLSLLVSIAGCQSNQVGKDASRSLDKAIDNSDTPSPQDNKKLEQLPEQVSRLLLMPDAAEQETPLFSEERYDIAADQTDARNFFAGLVEGTPYSVAIHPGVTGNITLDLKQVTLSEVFNLVSGLYGYHVQRSGSVFRIYPSGMRTETFAVNYLMMTRDGATQSSIVSGGVSTQGGGNNNNGNNVNSFGGNQLTGGNQYGNSGNLNSNSSNSNGTNILTRTQTDFWKDLKESLQSLIGDQDGRVVIVSPQAGLVTIKAMPEEIQAVQNYLQLTEQTVQRQVVLEARIIEVTLNDEYQQGIDWTKIANSSRLGPISFSGMDVGNAISNSLGGITGLQFETGSFSSVLTLLSTQGNMQVLSSPRVTATNNQKAVIKVGDDEYFVTDVSSQSTITAATTSTGPNIELTPFFSGIALDVTPQIDAEGGVLLHVHPSVIETQEQEKVVTLNEERFVLPLAQSNIRESDTVIHARTGEIVVIGGLMQTIINETHSKTPLLGTIPLFGELFKNRRESEQKKELVILLKPTVVERGTWQQQLRSSRDQIRDWTDTN